jgi:ribose/xylose/arabinose/galactoside ABC-type transport system permease subunit
MAFGMSLAILAKGIDISMASVMVLSCYLSAPFFQQGTGSSAPLLRSALASALAFAAACSSAKYILSRS